MKVTINNQNFNILLLGKIYSGQHKCWTREINFSYILNNPLWGDLHQNSFRRKSFFFFGWESLMPCMCLGLIWFRSSRMVSPPSSVTRG